MRSNTISLTDFRNFSSLKTELHPGVNIFYGRNGSGKTNLLEALFVLCLGRSQRGAPDVLLVRNGCDVYRLEGAVESEGRSQTLAVAYQRHSRKKITIDSVAVRIAELYEQFLVVSAGPEDSAILSGPPSVRRAFVDIYLSQLSGKYLADLVGLARRRLGALGVARVYGNDGSAGWCTVQQPHRYHSHRRDHVARGGSGRMAACIWLA